MNQVTTQPLARITFPGRAAFDHHDFAEKLDKVGLATKLTDPETRQLEFSLRGNMDQIEFLASDWFVYLIVATSLN